MLECCRSELELPLIDADQLKRQMGRMQSNWCQVCQSEVGTSHLVREMRLGSGEKFPYWECADCGCLTLADVPDNLEKYHAGSYSNRPPRRPGLVSTLRNRLQLSALAWLMKGQGRIDLDILRQVPLTKSMRLLEVGCGVGSLVGDMRELGYDARGVDPFIAGDIEDRFGTRVERKDLADAEGEFDVILFLHSLSQLPIETLQLARSRLKSNGLCIARIPILGWAWRNYGTDWAHLDAPRNLFLHTRRSFHALVEKSGFLIERAAFDSDEFQFWASESYPRRIPLSEMEPPTARQLSRMRRLAHDLNQQEQGDTARFYLRPA
jgi:hypothetical protein